MMLSQFLVFTMPIVWAIVSTAIALVLYKTGRALIDFEDETTMAAQRQKRRVVLGGSVAIAAVAFYGMKQATPKSVMSVGEIVMSGETASKMRVRVAAADDSAMSLLACFNNMPVEHCKAEIDFHTRSLKDLREVLGELRRAGSSRP